MSNTSFVISNDKISENTDLQRLVILRIDQWKQEITLQVKKINF